MMTSLASEEPSYGFPGRWVGGASMIAGPLLLLSGVLVRLPFHFFFPQQLEACASHPSRMFAAYSLFVAGVILTAPAIVALAQAIGRTHPGWATWGGTLTLLGLFARAFHAGADHVAFELVRIDGAASATRTVAAIYGGYHVVSALNPAIMSGWVVLAVGGFRSRVLHPVQSVGLAAMSSLMIGILKGSSIVSVLATVGLCVAFVPLGVRLLTEHPRPTARRVVLACVGLVALTSLFVILGSAG